MNPRTDSAQIDQKIIKPDPNCSEPKETQTEKWTPIMQKHDVVLTSNWNWNASQCTICYFLQFDLLDQKTSFPPVMNDQCSSSLLVHSGGRHIDTQTQNQQ